MLRLNITSDLVGGGVQQDRGDGAHGEGGQDSTLQCDSPDRMFYLRLYCNALINQRPNRTLIYSRLKAKADSVGPSCRYSIPQCTLGKVIFPGKKLSSPYQSSI